MRRRRPLGRPPAFDALRDSARRLPPSDVRAVLLAGTGALENLWGALSEYQHERKIADAMARTARQVTTTAVRLDMRGPTPTVEEALRRIRLVRALAEAEQDRRAARGGR